MFKGCDICDERGNECKKCQSGYNGVYVGSQLKCED